MEQLNINNYKNNGFQPNNTTLNMLDDLSCIEKEICRFNVADKTPQEKSYYVEFYLSKNNLYDEEKGKYLRNKLEKTLEKGNGAAYILLGVNDNGESVGIGKLEEAESFEVLDLLSIEMKLKYSIVKSIDATKGKLIEILVMNIAGSSDIINYKPEIRIGMFGDEGVGKSTLIGVLVDGVLDDGNGLSRSNIFRFQHEQYSGKTSNFSHYVSDYLKPR